MSETSKAKPSMTERLKSLLPRSAFGRALAIVSGGTALGQIITTLASPLLARLFSPNDFGLLAIYASLVGAVAMIGGLTYPLAIVLPEDEGEGANVLALSVLLVVASSGLLGVGIWIAWPFISSWERADAIRPYLWMVPLGALGIGLFEALTPWATRTKAFTPLARASVQKGAAQTVVQAGWGLAASSPFGLIFGQLVGHWSGIAGLAVHAWRGQRDALRNVRLSVMREMARRYKRFPMFTLPEVMINAVSTYAPPILLAYYFGGAVAGFYTVQDRVTLIPIRFIGSSAQRVFFASAAEAKREGKLDVLMRDVFAQLLRLGLPFLGILAACAPSAFAVVFGGQWKEAGVYAQWLCIRTAFTLAVFPLTPIVYVYEKQWAGTGFQVLLLICRVSPVILGGVMGSSRLAIAVMGVAVGFAWLVYLAYLLVLTRNPVWPVLRVAGLEVVKAAAFVVPIAIARALGLGDWIITGLAALMGLAALGALVRRRSSLRIKI